MTRPEGEVMFDILLRSPAARGQEPHLDNIQEFHPPAAQRERCRRWFTAQGVELHGTSFGLSGSTTCKMFESIFRVELRATEGTPGKPAFEAISALRPPEALADAIDQITITALPELF